jgi:hypothetical protein
MCRFHSLIVPGRAMRCTCVSSTDRGEISTRGRFLFHHCRRLVSKFRAVRKFLVLTGLLCVVPTAIAQTVANTPACCQCYSPSIGTYFCGFTSLCSSECDRVSEASCDQTGFCNPYTPTPTATPTNTPGLNDCCQCAMNCAVPLNGSCGSGCTLIIDAACRSGELCVLNTPTPTATPRPTQTPTNPPGPNDCCACSSPDGSNFCVDPARVGCGGCTVIFGASCANTLPAGFGSNCVLHTATPTVTSTPTVTPTPTDTVTATATPTGPGSQDCCQCADFCAVPIAGTCGGCAVVLGASCADGLCISRTLTQTVTTTLTFTATVTSTPTLTVPATQTATLTNTVPASPTSTATLTPTNTTTPTNSSTKTPMPTLTFTSTVTSTPTDTPPTTPTSTRTQTAPAPPTQTVPPTNTRTGTRTPTNISTQTPTLTSVATITGTPTPPATMIPTPAPTIPLTSTPTPCVGDCNGNGQVTVDEILTLVNIALGKDQVSRCPHGIPDGAAVDVALILQAVNNALNGGSALIDSVTATYAANCGHPTDVSPVFNGCLEQLFCSITFSAPDPAFGCAKDLDVSYLCSGDPALRHVHVEPEALHKLVSLSCG